MIKGNNDVLQLYNLPVHTDKEMNAIQPIFGIDDRKGKICILILKPVLFNTIQKYTSLKVPERSQST